MKLSDRIKDYFEGTTVAVTGGHKGLGWYITQAFAQAGAKNIALVGREIDDQMQTVVHGLGNRRVNAAPFAADLREPDEAKRFIDHIGDQFGELDILVNNVGGSPANPKRILDCTSDDVRKMVDLNVGTAVNCIHHGKELLSKSKKACTVGIGTLGTMFPDRNRDAYCLAKAALENYMRAARIDLADLGIHALLVTPGPIKLENKEPTKNGGGSELKTTPEVVITAMLNGIIKGRLEIVIPWKAALGNAISAVRPSFRDSQVRKYT